MVIVQKPVRNYSAGRSGYQPQAIVIHIAEGYLAGAYDWFNRPESQASSHYMVSKSGEIWQFVDEANTAWHAGGVAGPSWSLLKSGVNPNLYTIGIEHEGFTGEVWPDKMYKASCELVVQICGRWEIPVDRAHIIGHYQINSQGRANCPGTGVDLNRLVADSLILTEDPAMIAELQAQITSLQNAQQGLRSEISNLRAAQQDLLNQISGLQTENNSLKQRLAAASNNTSSAELTTRVQQLTEEVYSLQQVRNKLSSQVEQLQAENSKLKQTNSKAIGSYSVGDLIGAIGNKIFPRNR